MMKEYKVGQVLFLAKKGKVHLTPVLVVEEMNKKTLDGETRSYTVQMGVGPNAKVFSLFDAQDFEVFDNATIAKNTLTERVTSAVHNITVSAVQQANDWYPGLSVTMESQKNVQLPTDPNDPSVVQVILGDGSYAKVKIPTI